MYRFIFSNRRNIVIEGYADSLVDFMRKVKEIYKISNEDGANNSKFYQWLR